MQKVTAFLEKYVEWVAISLGLVYLLWMVYAYVLNTKALDVTVGTTEMAPSKVDNYVLTNVAEPLAAKIKAAKPVPITVPPFGEVVNLDTAPPPALATNWTTSQTKGPQLPDQAPNPNNPNAPVQPGPGGAPPAANNRVVELPKPPAPTDLATAMGRTSVVIPPQAVNATYLQQQQAALAPPPPDGQAPQQPQPQPQQQQQQQIQLGTDGKPIGPDGKPLPGTDIDWVTVSYKIHVQDLAAEFTRCSIPSAQQGQGNTCFLDVELLRQEQLPNGQWGKDTVIPKLTTSDQPTTMPSEGSSRPLLQAYLNWAMGSIATLLHPSFYTYIQGDQWMLSTDLTGMTVVGDNGEVKTLGPQDTRPGFDPTQYISMNLAQRNAVTPPLTQKEKQLIAAAIDAKHRADAKAKAQSTPPPSPRGGRGTNQAPIDNDQARPANGRPLVGGGDANAGGGLPEGGPGGNPGAQQPQQPPSQAEILQKYQQMFPLPSQADFDPRTMANPQGGAAAGQAMILVGWAHDATAQPGKTYRYAVRYKVKSPVWGTFNTTNPATLVNTFALVSATSDWTQPVAVPPVVRFYFTSASSGPSMPVEVYRWQNGIYNKTNIRVSPGDPVGKMIGDVDYATNFTVVDFRESPTHDDTFVWLLNPDGQLVRRDTKADSNGNDLNQMRHLYEQQQAQLQAQQQQQNGGQPGANPGAPGAAPAQPNPAAGGRPGGNNDAAH